MCTLNITSMFAEAHSSNVSCWLSPHHDIPIGYDEWLNLTFEVDSLECNHTVHWFTSGRQDPLEEDQIEYHSGKESEKTTYGCRQYHTFNIMMTSYIHKQLHGVVFARSNDGINSCYSIPFARYYINDSGKLSSHIR